MRLERTAAAQLHFPDPGRPTCGRTIRLGWHTYTCARHPHEHGIHDANCTHAADGGLVRW